MIFLASFAASLLLISFFTLTGFLTFELRKEAKTFAGRAFCTVAGIVLYLLATATAGISIYIADQSFQQEADSKARNIIATTTPTCTLDPEYHTFHAATPPTLILKEGNTLTTLTIGQKLTDTPAAGETYYTTGPNPLGITEQYFQKETCTWKTGSSYTGPNSYTIYHLYNN